MNFIHRNFEPQFDIAITSGFARIKRVGVEAKLGFKVHPHMLRQTCGYALVSLPRA
jgi:integrase